MFEKLIKQWKDEAGCKGVIQYKYSYLTNTLTIFTPYPVYLIGEGGMLVDKYKPMFKNIRNELNSIEFVETNLKFIK
jgi:hypothetical protein